MMTQEVERKKITTTNDWDVKIERKNRDWKATKCEEKENDLKGKKLLRQSPYVDFLSLPLFFLHLLETVILYYKNEIPRPTPTIDEEKLEEREREREKI